MTQEHHPRFCRALLMLVVEFFLWIVSGALPSWVACLQFVALRLVVTRLPLIPNKDLLFAAVLVFFVGNDARIATLMALITTLVFATHLALGAIMAGGDLALSAMRRRSR